MVQITFYVHSYIAQDYSRRIIMHVNGWDDNILDDY